MVYFGAYLVAGLLAPALWLAVQAAAAQPGAADFWHWLGRHALPRYVDRLRMLAAAAALLWLIGRCGLWGRFGFFWNRPGALRGMLDWLLLGVATIALVAGWRLLSGAAPDAAVPAAGRVARVLAGALAGALLLAWLEEAIFRGMVLRIFYTALAPLPALILSALFFAMVHFKRVPWPDGTEVGWLSGLEVAWRGSLSVVHTFDPGRFATLVLVGLVLGVLFLRTGSLLPCLGLHAGWVWARGTWEKLGGAPVMETWPTLLLLSLLLLWLSRDAWRRPAAPA